MAASTSLPPVEGAAVTGENGATNDNSETTATGPSPSPPTNNSPNNNSPRRVKMKSINKSGSNTSGLNVGTYQYGSGGGAFDKLDTDASLGGGQQDGMEEVIEDFNNLLNQRKQIVSQQGQQQQQLQFQILPPQQQQQQQQLLQQDSNNNNNNPQNYHGIVLAPLSLNDRDRGSDNCYNNTAYFPALTYTPLMASNDVEQNLNKKQKDLQNQMKLQFKNSSDSDDNTQQVNQAIGPNGLNTLSKERSDSKNQQLNLLNSNNKQPNETSSSPPMSNSEQLQQVLRLTATTQQTTGNTNHDSLLSQRQNLSQQQQSQQQQSLLECDRRMVKLLMDALKMHGIVKLQQPAKDSNSNTGVGSGPIKTNSQGDSSESMQQQQVQSGPGTKTNASAAASDQSNQQPLNMSLSKLSQSSPQITSLTASQTPNTITIIPPSLMDQVEQISAGFLLTTPQNQQKDISEQNVTNNGNHSNMGQQSVSTIPEISMSMPLSQSILRASQDLHAQCSDPQLLLDLLEGYDANTLRMSNAPISLISIASNIPCSHGEILQDYQNELKRNLGILSQGTMFNGGSSSDNNSPGVSPKSSPQFGTNSSSVDGQLSDNNQQYQEGTGQNGGPGIINLIAQNIADLNYQQNQQQFQQNDKSLSPNSNGSGNGNQRNSQRNSSRLSVTMSEKLNADTILQLSPLGQNSPNNNSHSGSGTGVVSSVLESERKIAAMRDLLNSFRNDHKHLEDIFSKVEGLVEKQMVMNMGGK